jgi:DNA mismatch repair protein MutS
MAKVTPLRQQYLHIKRQHPDAVLFFRLGDFYETFDEDAEIAARELDLVLTSRPVAKNVRVPMAGVPHHAIEGYIARLIEKGYRVALAEQVGEVTGKGLVAREVTRVVTPGTVIEPTLLDAKRANYLAAVVVDDDGQRAGLAFAEITTGEFATTEFTADGAIDAVAALEQELSRLAPRECLLPEVVDWKDTLDRQHPSHTGALRQLETRLSPFNIHWTPWPVWRFEPGQARQTLLDHFKVSTLAAFGCEGKPWATCAAGAILAYLRETQKSTLAQITGLSTYHTGRFMTLDPATRRNLELTEAITGAHALAGGAGGRHGSLLGVVDATQTPMGARLLRGWLNQPLLDRGALEERLERVQGFFDDGLARAAIRDIFKLIPDLERLTNRVLGGSATPRDLDGIHKALAAVPAIQEALPDLPTYQSVDLQLDPCTETAALVASALSDDPPAQLRAGGVIRPGFSAELDGIALASRDAKQWVANLEKQERERTGIKNLKVGYNKVFGYYLEVTKSNLDSVPQEYIRKQTLVNSERFITPELKEYESLILNAEERLAEIEARLFQQVRDQVAVHGPALLKTARALARLDVAAALAEVARRQNYVRPELTEDQGLEIVAGRHPVVERTHADGAARPGAVEPFTPNDLSFDDDRRLLIVTGPNMAGKSVYLRQAALIVLLAQIGAFVPADRARIGLVDRIFTRIGAQDEVAGGRSTFMVEMVETAYILAHATPRSLIILDEVGRGTSTYDGMAIARATVEYLHNHPRLNARTLFATHYHELTELERYLPGVRNLNMAVAEEGDRVIFLHKVIPGGADRSYGIHVAQLAGMPRAVVNRANEILSELEEMQAEQRERVRQQFRSAARQLALFNTGPHPAIESLQELKVEELSPLEAINKLYEMKRMVKSGDE